MIAQLLSRFRSHVLRAATRFVRNSPANKYEGVVFDALRSMFALAGEGKVTPA